MPYDFSQMARQLSLIDPVAEKFNPLAKQLNPSASTEGAGVVGNARAAFKPLQIPEPVETIVKPKFDATTIHKGASQGGTELALTKQKDGAYAVYAKRGNYDAHVRGGIRYSWGFVKKDLPWSDALALYNKRLSGKK